MEHIFILFRKRLETKGGTDEDVELPDMDDWDQWDEEDEDPKSWEERVTYFWRLRDGSKYVKIIEAQQSNHRIDDEIYRIVKLLSHLKV